MTVAYKYRVVGYNHGGGVVVTVLCDENQTEKAHDDVMSTKGVKSAVTFGPLAYSRAGT